MKIEVTDEKTILYLENYYFKTKDKENLTKEIKDIFIKLIKYYKFNFSGIYEVNIFENNKYGTILEIIKKDELLFSRDIIDIKVKIKKYSHLYLKTKDYFVFKDYKDIYYQDNNYYIDIKSIDNYLKVIESCELIYNQKDNYLTNMFLIK